jgi:hypothetical protein
MHCRREGRGTGEDRTKQITASDEGMKKILLALFHRH